MGVSCSKEKKYNYITWNEVNTILKNTPKDKNGKYPKKIEKAINMAPAGINYIYNLQTHIYIQNVNNLSVKIKYLQTSHTIKEHMKLKNIPPKTGFKLRKYHYNLLVKKNK